jgi:GT2 family glycosyltransferase
VVVDNGAPPQGFSAPVNSGLRAARGAFMVVCNDDVEVLEGWWEPLRAALTEAHDPAAVAFPMTVDGAMRPDFAAWCFAISRRTLEDHAIAPGEFLHPELKVWYQDTDLLHRLRSAGRPPRLVAASRIRHGLSETVATRDPALRAWLDAQIRRDKARFEALHGAGVPGAAA